MTPGYRSDDERRAIASRNRAMWVDREFHKMTYRALGEKYLISQARARQVIRKEQRRRANLQPSNLAR